MKKPTYFVSYTSRVESDVEWAKWVEWVLREDLGGDTIMQEYDFRPGDNFRERMDDALQRGCCYRCYDTQLLGVCKLQRGMD
jgi:hypothetical protein